MSSAKEREKTLKMLARKPDGYRGVPGKTLTLHGSQLSIDPLTLTVRMAAKGLVEQICEGAVWERKRDGFGFRIPTITGEMMQKVASEARNILGVPFEDPEGEGKKASRVSFLTRTSKMGCYSFNLPAGPPEFGGACPASGLGFLYRQERPHEDQERFEYEDWGTFTPNPPTKRAINKQKWICNACYALKGNYSYTSNQIGQMIKFGMVKKMLRKGGWNGRDFASYMLEAISYSREKSLNEMKTAPAQLRHQIPHPDYFRIHDSGDFFREEYWYQWVTVMENLPDVKFWAPTRMWVLSKPLRYLIAGPMTGNLAIRPSALHFGDPAPTVEGLAWGASAANDIPSTVWTCPAYDQEHLYGGSGPVPVTQGAGKKKTVREGFYYCAHPSEPKKFVVVPEDDLSACKVKGGKAVIRMEAGSCQRAHGPGSPGLPAAARYLPVVQEDLPIRQGGLGCRACWDMTTPVWYHEH